MEEIIKGFITSILSDGKSRATAEAYRRDLAEFAVCIDGDFGNIKYNDLRDWANQLSKRGLSPAYRARKISAVKSFFKYLYKMEMIYKNPADGLAQPKQEQKQPVVISREETALLLESGKKCASWSNVGYRDYAIIATILYTGMRREEITSVRLSDVNLAEGRILIHGKGSKQRIAYINEELNSILSEYVSTYRIEIAGSVGSDYLFPSRKSNRMSMRSVNDVVNKAYEQVGIKKKGMGAHILRKRFATSVFEKTGNVATLSKMLGHTSPTVTMRYVVIGEGEMRDAINGLSFD